ncbi:MAG: hypothetical protein DI539_01470 [Flavobacterium psychrophilum]|nr:MAG: hypothetical protein DI539_01470 [Flavobacterium psychrophilum]
MRYNSKPPTMNSHFSVPKPCHENWNAMTPAEQGRFCSVCSKNVTDFTQMSNEEIVVYLRKNSANGVCGRFRNDQLQQKIAINIPNRVLYSQTKFRNIFLLALLVTMGSTLVSCMGKAVEDEAPESHKMTPPKTTNVTLGEVAYPDDSVHVDSVPLPPPVPVKEAPKATKE